MRERKEIAAGSPWPRLIQALGTGAGNFRSQKAPSLLLPCQGEARRPRIFLPDVEVAKRFYESWEQRFGCLSCIKSQVFTSFAET